MKKISKMDKKNILLPLLVCIIVFFGVKNLYADENVIYKGPIFNVFFHPLIVYPELAFNKKNPHLTYMDDWFVTLNEFKKILPELYKSNFILVSVKDLFKESTNDYGQLIITRKKLFLPPGKKPLILSLDDYNFYKTMKMGGTIYRFEVDDQGRLLTVTNRNGKPAIIRDDQEVPQLLEKFITEHPDFSYNKARGIIALTGYNGIFGYNTQETFGINYSFELAKAKKVVKKLKEMGWEFASHSYFHLSETKQTEQAFENSEKRWKNEVETIIGPTSYYIYPFGESWDENHVRMKFLKGMGYKYFFEVSQSNELTILPGVVVMGRFPMDGNALRGKYKKTHVFLNTNGVLDPSRLAK